MDITRVNITATAFGTQLALSIIGFIAALILKRGAGRAAYLSPVKDRLIININRLPTIIFITAMIPLACLFFSHDFSSIWGPVLGGSTFPTLTSSSAMFIMFVLDIVAVGYLAWLTGDSQSSPFTPMFFVLPALAIFLRESFGRVTLYTVLIILLFSGLMFVLKYRESEEEHRSLAIAYWFISIACLVLTTFIAYVTRTR